MSTSARLPPSQGIPLVFRLTPRLTPAALCTRQPREARGNNTRLLHPVPPRHSLPHARHATTSLPIASYQISFSL
ncbi:hypothetical protein E2C01_078699 [Portunus trituberculatus]|uniref:Uncharacterized protein n=1 Tax=Portunus trituberculatus TaxID=210409 RepID=A0A5B7ING2_PORTR|nr:hypothetical protein [Portunus trituberculatus]